MSSLLPQVNRKPQRRPTRNRLRRANRCKPRQANRNQRPQVTPSHPQRVTPSLQEREKSVERAVKFVGRGGPIHQRLE